MISTRKYFTGTLYLILIFSNISTKLSINKSYLDKLTDIGIKFKPFKIHFFKNLQTHSKI